MIPYANDTITLYNRYKGVGENDRTEIRWFRRVLTGCSWRIRREATSINGVLQLSGLVSVRIPKHGDYLPYEAWSALPERAGRFTLSVGDVICLGEGPDSADEALRARGAMTVNHVGDNARPGYPLPHYLARGV